MPSILSGLFSGRSGLSSHGSAISVVGDNIANANTTGYKTSRAEFSDLMAGGQASGRVIGSGSQLSSVTSIVEQGTLEFTSRPLDLAIDGNGYFVVADGAQKFYTRAGNFKTNASGYMVNSEGLAVLGYPSGGSGALQPLNLNSTSQSSVVSTELAIAGNVDASSAVIAPSSIPTVVVAGQAPGSGVQPTYADLQNQAAFSTVANIYDSLGAAHTVSFYYFHTSSSGSPQWTVQGYVNNEEVDPTPTTSGQPRLISSTTLAAGGAIPMGFNGDGTRVDSGSGSLPTNGIDLTAAIPWTNGSDASALRITMSPFTQYSAPSTVLSITQDGQGVGSVSKINVQENGDVYAILDNGQSSVIGKIGMANFANPEGLVRIGNSLLQKTPQSGEPIYGKPSEGKFGKIQAGSQELSTVDVANEFVKLITLQRGFQANSRIITTVNQLLNDIIQLA